MKLGISGSTAELLRYPELWGGGVPVPEHVQLNGVADDPHAEKAQYERAIGHMRACCPGAEFSMHAYKCNLTEKSPRIRRKWLRIAQETLCVAGELGMKLVVFHLGSGSGGSRIQHSAYRDRLVPVLEELTLEGRRHGVEVHIENLYQRLRHAEIQMLGDRPGDFLHWFSRIDSSWLKLCYDYGHGNIDECGIEILRGCKDRLGSLHVHDNDQLSDLHRAMNAGTIDWERERQFLKAIDFKGPFILEAAPAVQAVSLRYLREEGWF